MERREKIEYVAFDGMAFPKPEMCLQYETALKIMEYVKVNGTTTPPLHIETILNVVKYLDVIPKTLGIKPWNP